jgi:hypothetical protein
MVLSIIFLEDKHKIVFHLSIFYEYKNLQSLERTFYRCFLPSFGSFGQAVSEEEIFGQSETRIACGGHVCYWIGTKCAIFREDLL